MELKVIVETVIGIIGLFILAFGFVKLIKVYREICTKLEDKVQWLEVRVKQCHLELDSLDYCSIDLSRDLEDKRKVEIFLQHSDLELLEYDLDYLIKSMESDIEDYPEDIVKKEKLQSKLKRTKVLYRHIKTFVESTR